MAVAVVARGRGSAHRGEGRRRELTQLSDDLEAARALGHGARALLTNYTFYFMLNWLPTYLQEERGFSTVGMAKVASSAYLVNALSALAAGYLIDRYLKRGGSANSGYKSVMAVAHIGFVACMLAMAVGSPALAMLSLFVYQALCGASSPGCYAMCQVLAGPRASGRWVGVQNSLGNLPGIIAPALTAGSSRPPDTSPTPSCGGGDEPARLVGWIWMVPTLQELRWSGAKAPA